MTRDAAVWVDHKEAVIAALAGDAETLSRVKSDARHGGAVGADSGAEDQRDRHYEKELRVYFDEVISHVRDADGILLMGPGEAKRELEKRMRDVGLGGQIVAVETTDKLTDHQIAAKARERFRPRDVTG